MNWTFLALPRKSKSNFNNQGLTRPSLETLEERAVPALLNSVGTLWFYQNLSNDPALLRQTLSLWQKDNQTLQYKDMIQIFDSVAGEHPSVTQTDLGDLQNLVSHGSAVGWMPQYVSNLSSKVVNYNLSNKFYQFEVMPDGQPMKPNLLPSGALKAGDPSSDLVTLVDKWFLGLDHPDLASTTLDANASGSLSGATALGDSSLSYQLASGVLWGSGGPSNQDIDQGVLGDCYFLSSLGATVTVSPQTIENMFINNGNGTYTIRFFIPNSTGTQYTPDYVTIDQMLPFETYGPVTTAVGTFPQGYYFDYANGGTSPQGAKPGDYGKETNLNTGPPSLNAPYQYPYPANHLWVALLEKAYTQFNAQIPIKLTGIGDGYNLPDGANSFYVIGEGGYSSNSFNNAGTKITTYGALSEVLGHASTYDTFPSNGGTLTAATLINLVNSNQAVTLTSYDSESGKGGHKIVTNHIYYVVGYNSTTQLFTVYNPWGYDNTNEGKPGTLQLPFSGTDSLNQFFGYVGTAPIF